MCVKYYRGTREIIYEGKFLFVDVRQLYSCSLWHDTTFLCGYNLSSFRSHTKGTHSREFIVRK